MDDELFLVRDELLLVDRLGWAIYSLLICRYGRQYTVFRGYTGGEERVGWIRPTVCDVNIWTGHRRDVEGDVTSCTGLHDSAQHHRNKVLLFLAHSTKQLFSNALI